MSELDKDGWEAAPVEDLPSSTVPSHVEAATVPESVYKAVERILDENSAWIARPNAEVTQHIALAATIAAKELLRIEAIKRLERQISAFIEKKKP